MATSFRANTDTPQAGANTTVQPTLPRTVQLQSLAYQLFQNSGYNDSILNKVSVIPNGQIQFNLTNCGLVDKVLLAFEGQIPFKNTAGTTQAVQLSPIFPYDTVSNINVVFNGQTTVLTASPYEFLGLAAKRNKNVYVQTDGGQDYTQATQRVSAVKASISAGNANITLNAGNGLTGYSSVTIAANSTGILKYKFVVELPFTMRRDIPVGIMALQNNSIICQVNITAPAWIGVSPLSPTYVASAIPATLTYDTAENTYLNCTPVQYYWETPADPKLYQFFVANSYMFIATPGQSFKTTGSQALQYQMPNNYILSAMLFTLRDANAALLDTYKYIENACLNYNNTTLVDKQPQQVRAYLQEQFYSGNPVGLGQVLWDACIHEWEGNNFSDSSMLNMYMANNPQFFMDIAATVATPGTFSVAREMIVPAQVKTA